MQGQTYAFTTNIGTFAGHNEFRNSDAHQDGWRTSLGASYDSKKWRKQSSFIAEISLCYGELSQFSTNETHLNQMRYTSMEVFLGARFASRIHFQTGVAYAESLGKATARNIEGVYDPSGIYLPVRAMLRLPIGKRFSDHRFILQAGFQVNIDPSGRIFDGYVGKEVTADYYSSWFIGFGYGWQ